MSNFAYADEANLKRLYGLYGELQIRAEIITGQISQVKQQIVQELQKPQQEVAIPAEKNLKGQ
jgi:hypothetical protein